MGGGGTRGWAQIGAIKYLFEKNISIDAYTGTSAGAICAAMLAVSRDYHDFLEIARAFSHLLKFNEYTLPVFSLLSAKSLTHALTSTFGTVKIEDLKKSLFCVATDLVSFSEVDIIAACSGTRFAPVHLFLGFIRPCQETVCYWLMVPL